MLLDVFVSQSLRTRVSSGESRSQITAYLVRSDQRGLHGGYTHAARVSLSKCAGLVGDPAASGIVRKGCQPDVLRGFLPEWGRPLPRQ